MPSMSFLTLYNMYLCFCYFESDRFLRPCLLYSDTLSPIPPSRSSGPFQQASTFSPVHPSPSTSLELYLSPVPPLPSSPHPVPSIHPIPIPNLTHPKNNPQSLTLNSPTNLSQIPLTSSTSLFQTSSSLTPSNPLSTSTSLGKGISGTVA